MNHKFRVKTGTVEAYQMTREGRDNIKEWPTWLHNAWGRPNDAAGSMFKEEWLSDLPSEDRLVIRNAHGVDFVAWNDWLVFLPERPEWLHPVKPDRFEAIYERVE